MSRYNEEEIKELEIGEKYTTIAVSEAFAMTNRQEFTLKEQRVISYAQYPKVLELIIQPKGKRKLFCIKVSESTSIIKGWDINIKLDSEQEGSFIMRGNALINCLGENEEDKERITQTFNKNLNPKFRKGIVVMSSVNATNRDNEKPVFLEEAENIKCEHAVLRRILERKEAV